MVGNIYKILEFKSNQFVLPFYSCMAMILISAAVYWALLFVGSAY